MNFEYAVFDRAIYLGENIQIMKLSNFWFNRLRSALALVFTLGFYGWTPIPASAAVEYNEKISFRRMQWARWISSLCQINRASLHGHITPFSYRRLKRSQTMTLSFISCQKLLSMQVVK